MTNSYPLLSSQNNCNICALSVCSMLWYPHRVNIFFNVIKIQIKFICIKHSCRSIWIHFSPLRIHDPFFYHQILLLNNVKRLETALKWRKVIKIKMLCPIPADFNLFFFITLKNVDVTFARWRHIRCPYISAAVCHISCNHININVYTYLFWGWMQNTINKCSKYTQTHRHTYI